VLPLTLEQAIEFLNWDECLEITLLRYGYVNWNWHSRNVTVKSSIANL